MERLGSDLAAGQPNGAFRTWCEHNPSKDASVIQEARGGINATPADIPLQN
jgi:hypothetical protein